MDRIFVELDLKQGLLVDSKIEDYLKQGLLVTTNEDYPHLQWEFVISVDNLSSPNDLIVSINPNLILPS